MEKEKKVNVNVSMTRKMQSDLLSYAVKHTQGNVSYAIRLAIDLLLSEYRKTQKVAGA